MLGTIFDLMILGFISFIVIITAQFKTGFFVNKTFSLWGYMLEIKGDKGKRLEYHVSKVI